MSRDQVADTADPERIVLKNERNDYIRALLETLSDDDKELVAMHILTDRFLLLTCYSGFLLWKA